MLTLSTAVGAERRTGYQGVVIEFSHIAPRLFTGFTLVDGCNLALPEKALLDIIYLRKGLPVADEIETETLDRVKLMKLAAPYPLRVREEALRLVAEAG